MKHIISDIGDVPPPVPMLDRRRLPDRRSQWRGGRRDSDWQSRPAGALALLTATERETSLLRRMLAAINLW
jgi:hypothetical protein